MIFVPPPGGVQSEELGRRGSKSSSHGDDDPSQRRRHSLGDGELVRRSSRKMSAGEEELLRRAFKKSSEDQEILRRSSRKNTKRRHTLEMKKAASLPEDAQASISTPITSLGALASNRPAPLNFGTMRHLQGSLDPVAEEETGRFLRTGSLSPKKLKDLSPKWLRSSTNKSSSDRNSGMSNLAQQVGNMARSLSPKKDHVIVSSGSTSPASNRPSCSSRPPGHVRTGSESPKSPKSPKMGAPASHKEQLEPATRRNSRISSGGISRLVASERAAGAEQEAQMVALLKAQMEAAEREAGEAADCEDAYDSVGVPLQKRFPKVGAGDVYVFAPGCTLAEVGEESRIPPVYVSTAGLRSHASPM